MLFSKISKRIFVAVIDFLILSISLYISLSIRSLKIQSFNDFLAVYRPFSIIIILTIVIFFMYDLYDKMTIKIYKELDKKIISSLILSSIIGSIIFYTSSSFLIAPKTILIIYILIASILIFTWRKYARNFIKSKNNLRMLVVAEGKELIELEEELKNNNILNIKKIDLIDLKENQDLNLYTKIKNKVEEENLNFLAINMHHPHIKSNISLFYDLFLEKINIVNFADLYEELFGKIPLENIDAGWFFSNFYKKENKFYPFVKRVVDLIISVPALVISLPFYLVVYLALKIQDGGSLFYPADRIGKNNKIFRLYKFRSMTDKKISDIDESSKDESKRITKFGKFIRKTRIDELPQLINVLKGDISLIGPRPESPKLVIEYSNQIPFYGIRHTITPGLSGYAQIYQDQNSVPKFGLATNETKEKLSYDVYYIKHRSLLLDTTLILKTIKNLLSRSGI